MAYEPGSYSKKAGSGYVPGANTPDRKTGYVPGKPGVSRKVDLKTPQGLETTAKNAGLDKQLERIPVQGENPKKIFSGGFISDVFDTLNTLDYAVVGTLKGKGFKQGIKERASFTDDAKDIPGLIAGTALDIAVDPLTYINPASALGKVSKAIGVAEPIAKGAKAVSETKAGQWLGRQLIYRYGQDPVYRRLAEDSITRGAVEKENIVRLFDSIKGLSSEDQKLISAARKAGNLDTLPANLKQRAVPVFERLDNLSREAIKELDLPKDLKASYEAGIGNYIKRTYRKYEAPTGLVEKAKTFFDKKPKRFEASLFKNRKDIPEELRKAWGEIEEFGYPSARAMLQLSSSVENAKFFKAVKNFASDEAQDGFQKLATTPQLGVLSGKYVPDAIFHDLNEIVRTPTDFEKVVRPLVAGFKYSKVVLNPATHARNVVSNLILNNFEGLSPARLDIYAKAASELKNKGNLYKEAKALGLGVDTYAAREIKDLLHGPEVTKLGAAKGKVMAAADKISDIYQKEEEWGKMAQYIFQREKGLSPEEAWKVAERATFNYAQVTPFIRRIRESLFGFPFITFTYKATPQVARVAATNPTKISNIGKIKNSIENLSNQDELARERASEPDWVRDGFYVKLPIKDKHGRSAYFDMTYILPFGDLISGNYLERSVDRETGLQEGVPESLVRKTAFPNIAKELVVNEDFYGNKIYLDSDSQEEQLRDIANYLIKAFAPPLLADQLPGGYRSDGTRRPNVRQRLANLKAGAAEGELGFTEAQTRTLKQELLKAAGLKINPVDINVQETLQQSQQKKALNTILQEGGATRKYESTYVPK